MNETRRQLLTTLSLAGAGALLVGCTAAPNRTGGATNEENKEPGPGENTPLEVTAAEDLMREHGLLRRALLVYQESAARLKQDPAAVPAEALEKTAQFFRVFGEDYHQKRLEEAYIFPVIRKSTAGAYVDLLMAQHARGREVTDYLLSVSKEERISSNRVDEVVKALESFVRMYEHHAAIEDTVVFSAWKATLGEQEFDQLGAKFEEIESEQFGGDGFNAALKRMEEIEASLGLGNLDLFTAPAPPKY